MNRREFLWYGVRAGATALIAPVLVSFTSAGTIGCGEDAAPSGGSGTRDSATFFVDAASGHTHAVSLSQADLVNIQAMAAVMGSTSFVSGHLHGFTFP